MVKFKFPGKPSKIKQRSLVSAYSVVVPSCDTSSVSEDLCFGLSLFESTFGEDDEGESFKGFTDEEISEAELKKKAREQYFNDEMMLRGLLLPVVPLTKIIVKDDHNIKDSNDRKSVSSIVKKSVKENVSKQKERMKSNKRWLLNKRILNRYHPKLQIRHNFKTLNKNSLMRFKHKTLSANYLSDRYCRKFILPSRSLHSSRVIKPNKRFMDHERSTKFKNTRLNVPPDRQEDVEYDPDILNSNINTGGKHTKAETSSNKVIIREARLNITTETTITGPFSAKKFVSLDKESRSGVITCGICGSVRFYKYVLQTRKFGIYSCEPCRRFILKMIKYSKQPQFEILNCNAENGVGNCVILPVASNRKKDSSDDSFAKNFRCEACLLSLCLQKYIMPASIKKSLIQLIPDDVKLNFFNGLSPEFKKSLPILDRSLNALHKTVSNEENHDKLRKRLNVHNYLKNARCSKRMLEKYDISAAKSKSFLHKRSNLHQRGSVKSKFTQESTRKDNYPEKDHYVPRGPRIKHVCRSASSVLKTSTTDKDFEDPPCNLSEADCAKNSRKNSDAKMVEKPTQMTKIRQCDDSIPTSVELGNDPDSIAKTIAQYRARTLQDFCRHSSDESDENEDKLISTDFWEAYDPDEVYKTGFPLISSEWLNVRALCFLCGSAGIEKLLYCVSCCEPYHWYCAEGPSAFREESELEKCRVNWVCRKCKVCSTCGERDSRTLISCQRCKNSYHDDCLTNKALNKRLFKSDRPWVCPSCLKCKSCNSNTVFTYVGNIPLCSLCFKLRQKGSFCPLCQRCYQDDDYNVKMMECGICEKWIHAKCEGLSHEKYQILSFLPDTIEFVCRLCCNVPPAQWWLAVEDELKAGYLGILKCLCKNKKISDLFKESPRKDTCRCVKFKKLPCPADAYDSDSGMEVDADSKSSSPKHADTEDAKICDTGDPESSYERCSYCCYNSETRNKINNDLLCIKAKVHNNQYGSLLNFHQELENVIREVEELDLIKTYRESLKKFFPWFDPECPRGDDHNEFHMPDIPVNENHPTVVDSSQREEAAEEEYQTLRSLMDTDDYDYENFKMLDLRKCNLCKGTGEAIPSEGGRLIYCGRNEWVHSNCALWSSEVFEEIDGSLQNVHSAISRGRQIRCNVCDKKGASVGCCYKNCAQTYHLVCAKKARCIFLQNRTIYCRNHDTDEVTLPFLNCEKDFEILRPVYIETDRKKKKLECHSNVKLRIGSLHVESLGKIDPHLSDNPKYILPIYFRCTRLFWSTTKPWKIIQYHIQIKLRYCSQDVKSDSEVNYTVDHSTVKGVERDQQIVKQVVANMVNKVSAKEDYANDLLLPELQEAIYKDLPNDLLNDKTLQDIWNNYDGITDLECSTERSASKKPANRITPKLDKCKKSSDLVAKPNDHMDGKKCTEDNKTGAKINGKYLRDKNDLKEDAAKKTPNALDDFYSELCNKVKRKINFENSAIAKKKIFDANFIGAEKLVGVDFYAEPDRAYKPPYVQTYENILQLDGMVDIHAEEEPVKCIKCHCTYRTTTSFERHLEMCNSDFGDYMISSCESDASSEEEKFNTCTKSVRYENTDVKYDSMTVEDHKPAISTNLPVFQGNVCGNTPEDGVYTFSTVQDDMQNGAMLQAFVQNVKQEPICMPEQANNIQDAVKFNLMNGKIKTEVICNDYATIGGASSNRQYTLNNVAAPVATQSYQIQNMAPTYVIQSFPKQEVIPTYVAVDNTIAECIQPQPQLQLQQITAMNQQPVNYQPAVIPTILGTAVMQPSVIETPTYYINTPQSGELFAPQNNIILPNQPMLFGMETVVSNTVMSSSQFMTQSLTGNVGSSTMYSTTTTQIFQAAKQMPQTIQPGYIVVNSPIQQHVPQVQHTAVKAPQAYTAISTPGSEKYMYVQVNHQPNVTVNSTAPKPVITKATRNTQSTPRNKPLKVMKVRNNKPTTIHTPQAKSSNDHKVYPTSYVRPNGTAKMMHLNGTCVNEIKEFLNIDTTPKPVQAPNTKFHLTGTALKPMIGETRPPPVTKYAKVDKCVNTDGKGSLHNVPSSGTTNEQTIQISYTIDGENLKCPGPVIKSWNLNIPVEGENSTQTNRTPVQQNPPQSKCPPKPIILRGTPPAPKHTPVIPKPAQTVQPKPSPKPQLRPEVKYAKVPPVRELSPPPICCNDMPDLDFLLPPPRPKPINGEKIEIKSDSEKLFDELLRQHMLSMENAGTPEPEYRKSPENSTVRSNVAKTSKSKYKPQTNVKKSPVEHDARTNGKRKIDLEKENFDKLRSLISEAENTKNWKTASISFEVNAEDGFSYKTNNLTDLWNKIIESVQKSRAKYKLPLLPKNALVNGDSVYSLLGFENNASKYLLEQLPDAWKCIFYKPVFHKSPLQSSKTSPSKNESGCARTEPFNSSHKYDMFGWLASRHRKPPKFMMISDSDIVNGNRRITSLNLPMAMRFRHLKETAKETVGVFRSDIHGRGLFCLRDIDPGEMVIEYAGEVIRSTLTDKREKYYTSKGIGCYMFRIDDKYVVDATMCGNAARFINHSCEPNCYSRIVDILGKKHILIFALRKIPKGEELTYDYKFPLEDDKIYCHCLSRKCRKYLN